MDQRPPHSNRLKVSDSFVHSCRAFVDKDIDNAFLWAIKVLEIADRDGLHLTENESLYIGEVLKRKGRKKRRN